MSVRAAGLVILPTAIGTSTGFLLDLAVSGPARFQSQSTDPAARDSDADGLWDGDEAFEGVAGVAIHLDGISMTVDLDSREGVNLVSFRSDPSSFDTDSDQMSDGQEIQGWTINIIHEKTKDRVEVLRGSPDLRVHSDPLLPDTDADGLKDFDEFQNTSDPNIADTDGDLILDVDEETGGHWQVEGKDPEFVGSITAFVTPRLGCAAGICIVVAWEMKLNYTVRDNAGLYYARTNVIGERIYESYFGVGVKQADVRVVHEVSLLSWKAIVEGFDINVTVADVNGNGVFGEPHADSIVQAVLKALFAQFVAFVKAVGEAASKLFDWIVSAFTQLLEQAFKPIFDSIRTILRRPAEALGRLFSKYRVGSITLEIKPGDIQAAIVDMLLGMAELSLGLLGIGIAFYAARIAADGTGPIGLTIMAILTVVLSALVFSLLAHKVRVTADKLSQGRSETNPPEINQGEFLAAIEKAIAGFGLVVIELVSAAVIARAKGVIGLPFEAKKVRDIMFALFILLISEVSDPLLFGLAPPGATECTTDQIGGGIQLLISIFAIALTLGDFAEIGTGIANPTSPPTGGKLIALLGLFAMALGTLVIGFLNFSLGFVRGVRDCSPR